MLRTEQQKRLTKAPTLSGNSCPALSDPTDSSLPGSAVRGIFQARILEWAAISFSRGFSQPRDRTWSPALQTDALASEPPGKLS